MTAAEPKGHWAVLDTPIGPVKVLLPSFTCELPDGRTGYFQREQTDCMRAAVATVLQVPYEQVPDLARSPGTFADELDRWARWGEWAISQGYRLRFHGEPPKDCGSYIAISPAGEDRYRHVLAVMSGHVHDPGSGFQLPPFLQSEPTFKVEFTLTFERTTPCSE